MRNSMSEWVEMAQAQVLHQVVGLHCHIYHIKEVVDNGSSNREKR